MNREVIERLIDDRNIVTLKKVINDINNSDLDDYFYRFRSLFLEIIKKYDLKDKEFFNEILDYTFDTNIYTVRDKEYTGIYFFKNKRDNSLNEFIEYFNENILTYFKDKTYYLPNEDLLLSIFRNLLQTNKSNLNINILDWMNVMIEKSNSKNIFFYIYHSLYKYKRNDRKILKYLQSKGYSFDSDFFNMFFHHKDYYTSNLEDVINYIDKKLSNYIGDISDMDNILFEYMIEKKHHSIIPSSIRDMFLF